MTTLYLIRHAEAEGNVFRRLHGQYNSLVTPNGKKQISALEHRFRDIPIDAVYASDLYRTCLTAQAICAPKSLPLMKEPRLRELNCGIWEDLPFGYLAHFDRERNHAFSHDPQRWRVEGCETFDIYTGRFMEALDEIAHRHEGGSVALFSHGMVMRGVLQRLFFPEEKDLGHAENTAVTKLLFDGKQYTLEALNDAGHIPYEISTLGKQLWWRKGDQKDFNMWFRAPQAEDAALLEALDFPLQADTRIAMLKDTAVGALAARPLQGEEAELSRLALLPAHRGKGLSAQLLGEAASLARKKGKTVLSLPKTALCPAAKALFDTFGFQNGRLALHI